MPRHPGYFWICFQMGADKARGAWPIKIVPNAFELQKNLYPDMLALKNGFKMLMQTGAGARPNRGIPQR